jgi:hypothetical protein
VIVEVNPVARQIKGMWLELTSADVLRSYMEYRGFGSVGALAAASIVGSGKQAKPLSKATVGHLHSGFRTRVTPETAAAIEKALHAPPGALFRPGFAPVRLPQVQRAA